MRDLVKEQVGMVVCASAMVLRIRASLQARLEGRNEGGDIEVMRLVDEIVKKEGYGLNKNGHAVDCWCSKCDLID